MRAANHRKHGSANQHRNQMRSFQLNLILRFSNPAFWRGQKSSLYRVLLHLNETLPARGLSKQRGSEEATNSSVLPVSTTCRCRLKLRVYPNTMFSHQRAARLSSKARTILSRRKIDWPIIRISLLIHDDNQRLILGGSTVHHQRLGACAGILVAGEMDEIRGDDTGFVGLKQCRSASVDFHDEASFDHMEQFLRARMHVLWSGGAGAEVDHAYNSLLHQLTLIFWVFSQDLGELFRIGAHRMLLHLSLR
jgi:hypothetical protein